MLVAPSAPALQAYSSTSLSFSSFTLGNGTLSAFFMPLGKLIYVQISLSWGSTTTGSGALRIFLPTGYSLDRAKFNAGYSGGNAGNAGYGVSFRDDSAVADYYFAIVDNGSGLTTYLQAKNSLNGLFTTTSPATMAVGDTIAITGWIPIL